VLVPHHEFRHRIGFTVGTHACWCLKSVSPLVFSSSLTFKLFCDVTTTGRSRTLSANNDGEEMLKHHEKLTDQFQWKVVGQAMTYKAVGTTVATYGLILWTAVVLPAISGYVDDLKSQFNDTLSHTFDEL
jgi:hypothetical protein